MIAPGVGRVVVFDNGQVMVFDRDGNQMPEHQGRYEEVAPRLRAIYPERLWQFGSWTRHKDKS